MKKGIYNISIIFLLIIFGYLLRGCRFDPNYNCGGDIPNEFGGCFIGGVSSDPSGVKMILYSSVCRNYLHGTLDINRGTRSFALEGEKIAEGFAELNGIDISDSSTKVHINVFLVKGDVNEIDDDTVTLQIKDEIPIGPLSRCEEDE